MHRQLPGDDAGFTLSELLVVLSLLTVVIGAAWVGMGAVVKSNEVSSGQGAAARDFSDPMEEMSMVLMQNLTVKTATPDRIEVWTDRDMNGAPELDAFYATPEGKLVFERWGYTTDRTTVTNHQLWVMSEANGNNSIASSSTPLFRYYRRGGDEITGLDLPEAPSAAVRVRILLRVNTGGGSYVDDTRDVGFRNRR